MKSPRYGGLKPKSKQASSAARGASRKKDTRCEILLRRTLWGVGLRYRVNRTGLLGRPDIVFPRAKVVVFVDGDFWHGRNLQERLQRLALGHNPEYWIKKLQANVARDRRVTRQLKSDSWHVIRLWESDIKRNPMAVAEKVAKAVRAKTKAK